RPSCFARRRLGRPRGTDGGAGHWHDSEDAPPCETGRLATPRAIAAERGRRGAGGGAALEAVFPLRPRCGSGLLSGDSLLRRSSSSVQILNGRWGSGAPLRIASTAAR